MATIWTLAVVIFLVLGYLLYRSMVSYTNETFGKKWLTIWGNKIYFWQSLIFVSVASTIMVMYILKWTKVLTF